MDLKILVVTSDPDDRTRLEHLLAPEPADDGVVTLRFAGSVDECRGGWAAELVEPAMSPDPPPDIILLNPLSPARSGANAIAELGRAFPHTPVALLVAARTRRRQGGHKAAHPAGAPAIARVAAQVVLASASHQLLLELLICIVAAARYDLSPMAQANEQGVVLESIADGVISTDAQGVIRYCNTAALHLTATAPGELLGTSIGTTMRLHDGKTLAPIEHPLLQTLATGGTVRLPPGAVLVRPDGSEIVIADASGPIVGPTGAIVGAVMVFHDVTDAHALQAQVDYLAWHDFLTGLPNRFAAQRHLARSLIEARKRVQPLAVMYLDLDRFKAVNDTLGHGAGDELLISVAGRLRECFRVVDLVSRQGGDEFVVLMAPGAGRLDAAHAAERIHAAIAQPHTVNGTEVHVGCSVGIALFPEHGSTDDTLLRNADTALHRAKADGRRVSRFFDDDMLTDAVLRKQMEDGMRQGLERHEFELFYQPKVRLADGAVCGCEALLRWHHPEWGWVSPINFVRSAEETGLIVPLGRWVLTEAIRQAVQWDAAGFGAGVVAINVSALELRQAAFSDEVEGLLAASGLAPARLQLELTESALPRDMTAAAAVLGRLKNIGLSLAIDDFGTGYSSLSYLAELPIDLLKVDRAFVHGIDHAEPRRRTLLRAILSLAQNLALSAVAEGIETEPEARFVTEAGCALGQGYFYGAALRAAEFERLFLRPAHA